MRLLIVQAATKRRDKADDLFAKLAATKVGAAISDSKAGLPVSNHKEGTPVGESKATMRHSALGMAGSTNEV